MYDARPWRGTENNRVSHHPYYRLPTASIMTSCVLDNRIISEEHSIIRKKPLRA